MQQKVWRYGGGLKRNSPSWCELLIRTIRLGLRYYSSLAGQEIPKSMLPKQIKWISESPAGASF